MTLKLDRIISIATLVVLVVAVILLVKRPAPVAQEPKPMAGTAANVQPVNSQALDQKPDPMVPASMPAQQTSPGSWQAQSSAGNSAASSAMTSAVPPMNQNLPASQSAKAAESHAISNSDAIGAAINQMLGASAGAAALSPESEVGSGAPNIKDQKVTYEGDTVHGQFLTEIGGRDVWVAISGHMGQKDGYATFDPTEFKVGDVNVPVALVNPALQRKLAEERDRLKISDSK
ncbi:MAG: hypothetical protein WAN65_31750 [Candidatus Sulfotelmatobacter sp.]